MALLLVVQVVAVVATLARQDQLVQPEQLVLLAVPEQLVLLARQDSKVPLAPLVQALLDPQAQLVQQDPLDPLDPQAQLVRQAPAAVAVVETSPRTRTPPARPSTMMNLSTGPA